MPWEIVSKAQAKNIKLGDKFFKVELHEYRVTEMRENFLGMIVLDLDSNDSDFYMTDFYRLNGQRRDYGPRVSNAIFQIRSLADALAGGIKALRRSSRGHSSTSPKSRAYRRIEKTSRSKGLRSSSEACWVN